MKYYRHMLAMIQKLQSLKVEKYGQILCVKKVPFRNNTSSHIYRWLDCGVDEMYKSCMLSQSKLKQEGYFFFFRWKTCKTIRPSLKQWK